MEIRMFEDNIIEINYYSTYLSKTVQDMKFYEYDPYLKEVQIYLQKKNYSVPITTLLLQISVVS